MKLSKTNQWIKSKFHKIKEQHSTRVIKIPTLVIILFTLEFLVIGGIILESSASQRVYECQSESVWQSNPLESNETRRLIFNTNSYSNPSERTNHVDTIHAATGQSIHVQFKTTDITTIKVFKLELWENGVTFYNETIHIKENALQYEFIIESYDKNSYYIIFVQNLGENTTHYEGSVIIQGINQDYFLLLLVPICFLSPLIILSFLLKRKKYVPKQDNYTSVDKIPLSLLRRVKLLWQANEHEFNNLYLIFIIIVLWLITQPIISISEDFMIGYSINTNNLMGNLTIAELLLIRPLFAYFLIIGLFIVIEVSELVTGKIKRKDILSFFTLPFSRIEWILVITVKIICVYGGIFFILLSMKAFLITRQINLFFPLSSFIIWFIFFLIPMFLWIIIGLICAFKSENRIKSAIIALMLISVHFLVNGISGTGIIFSEQLANYLWSNEAPNATRIISEINISYPFILTVPYIEVFFNDFIINFVLIGICLYLLVKIVKNFEIS